MPVIFKERHFDQLLILFNNLLILFLSLLILLTAFNLINEAKINNLKNDLELLGEEELKYTALVRDSAADERAKNPKSNKYRLLISLAESADKIIYSSLHLKNNKLNLKAVSAQQDTIFSLIDALEIDKKFRKVNLVNINQQESYYFELEILTEQ